MLLSPIRRYSGITALLVCTLEIISAIDLQSNSSYIKIPKLDEFNTKNSTISNYDHPSLNKEEALSTNGILLATSSRETKISKGLRKVRRRKFKKNRKQHKGLSTTTESSLVAQNGNQTETDQKIKKKRRRKLRRRKNRKNRLRQQNLENTNILEITTAKEILLPTISKSNSTINELIRKLNENPEHNFDEFTTLQANSSNLNETSRNVAKLVSPVHANPEFTAALHNNITLHISIGNASKHVAPIKRNNRCRRKKGGCAHFCNPKGKMKCSCFKGFALAADQRTCLDIDECKTNNGGCEMECRNTLGSFDCRCPNGLRLADDLKSCSDINECLLRNGHGPCQDTCENTFGSYKCSCRDLKGTVLSDDGYSCTDINECLIGNGGCSHTCINTLGRVFCSCPEGMELSSDWNTCQDINECEDETIKKSCRECVNTEGSYLCMDTAGYQSDELTEVVTCQPLLLPEVGFISCSRDGAKKFYTKRGRQRVTNSPGTICKLNCPIGYRKVGHYYIACDSFGRWKGKTDARCIRVEPPTLTCPPTQIFIMDKKSERTLIKFPPPKTNINWKYVKSFPSWAKELNRSLTKGRYDINFIARDPNSKLSASCTFKIIVDN